MSPLWKRTNSLISLRLYAALYLYSGLPQDILVDLFTHWLPRNVMTDDNLSFCVCKWLVFPEQTTHLVGHIRSWDVSRVTDMSRLFCCEKIGVFFASAFNEDIRHWEVHNVRNMKYMFSGCRSFNQSLWSWNTQQVVDMESMFNHCHAFNQPLQDWMVHNVRNMDSMFAHCWKYNQSVYMWKVNNVVTMQSMFQDCYAFNQDLSPWNVEKVTSFSFMFDGCVSLNTSFCTWSVNPFAKHHQMFGQTNVLFVDLPYSLAKYHHRDFNYLGILS